MKQPLFLVLIALLLGTNAAGAQPFENGSVVGQVQDRIIVTLREDVAIHRDKAADPVKVGVAALDALADRYQVRGMDPLYDGLTGFIKDKTVRGDLDRVWAVDFPASMGLNRVKAAYEALPQVEKAELVDICRNYAFLPNDPSISGNQWYLRNMNLGGGDIRAVGGWNQTLGDSNIVICILDSGVHWNHPDLGGDHPDKVTGAILTNWTEYYGTPGVDDDGNGKVDDIRGWDFVTGVTGWPGEDVSGEDNDPSDFEGHGTMCAGVAAAITNNGIGIAGAAPGCKILPVRCGWLPNGSSQGVVRMDFAAAGIIYAWGRGANIINCSWGSTSYLSSAVSSAQNGGVQFVTAAGNDNTDSDPGAGVPSYLSTRSGVLAVAATNAQDAKTSFSNFGSWVECAAPGEGIYTTSYNASTGQSVYTTTQGTSFSSPLTAGALALIWSSDPSMTALEVRSALLNACDNIDAQNPGYVGQLGAGRVNVLKALGDNVHQYPAEFPTLYDALNCSADDDTIAIEGGTVLAGPLDIPGKPISILGGYDPTYTSRDPLGNPAVVQGNVGSHALRFQGDVTPATVFDGFLVQGGGGQTLAGIPYSGRYGGGIMLNGESPTLRSLEVTGNSVGSSSTLGCGGGIAMHNSSAVLENVHVHGNTAVYGAGLFLNDSDPTLIGCVIEDNVLITDNASYPAKGGGLHLVDSAVDMTDCDVIGHTGLDQGGGIYAMGIDITSSLTMTGGSVAGNQAVNGGAGVYISGGTIDLTRVALTDNVRDPAATFMYGGGLFAANVAATLDSVTASGNDAHIGGGIHIQDSAAPVVMHSVLTGNTAFLWGGGLSFLNNTGGAITGNTLTENDGTLSGGGGLYTSTSDPAVENNIVAFNTGGATYANGMALTATPGAVSCNDTYGNTGADYSGIADPTGTAGNISLDPLFCNAAAGKYNVQPASPCAADNSGGCGLIGALASGCGESPVPEGGEIPTAFHVDQNFPNPFNPRTTIRFELPAAAPTRVTVFDVAGHLVKTLLDEDLAARTHEVTWTGDDEKGRKVAAGIYFYMVTSGNERSVGRMALVK